MSAKPRTAARKLPTAVPGASPSSPSDVNPAPTSAAVDAQGGGADLSGDYERVDPADIDHPVLTAEGWVCPHKPQG